MLSGGFHPHVFEGVYFSTTDVNGVSASCCSPHEQHEQWSGLAVTCLRGVQKRDKHAALGGSHGAGAWGDVTHSDCIFCRRVQTLYWHDHIMSPGMQLSKMMETRSVDSGTFSDGYPSDALAPWTCLLFFSFFCFYCLLFFLMCFHFYSLEFSDPPADTQQKCWMGGTVGPWLLALCCTSATFHRDIVDRNIDLSPFIWVWKLHEIPFHSSWGP